MDINKYVGERIKLFRIERNLTQQELGDIINTTSQTISRYEHGSLHTNQDTLFKLATYMKISISDFFPPLHPIEKEQESTSLLDNILYTNQEKIDYVRNLPKEKQAIIANAIKSVLDMIDDQNTNIKS